VAAVYLLAFSDAAQDGFADQTHSKFLKAVNDDLQRTNLRGGQQVFVLFSAIEQRASLSGPIF
jgi:hypothetical protein